MPSDSEDNSWLDMEQVPKPVKHRLVSLKRPNRRENFERVDNQRKKLASKTCKEQETLDRAKRTTGKQEVVKRKSVLKKEEKRRKEAEELKKKEEEVKRHKEGRVPKTEPMMDDLNGPVEKFHFVQVERPTASSCLFF